MNDLRARIGGHDTDLEALRRHFNHGDVRVEKDADGYYITAPALDALIGQGRELLDEARAIVRQLNGAARVLEHNPDPVWAEGRFDRLAPDGSKVTDVVIRPDSIHMRSTVGTPTLTVNGVVSGPPKSPAPKWVELAQTNPNVRDLLGLLGGPETEGPDWFDLWKIWEVIRDDVGGLKSVIAKGWLSATEFEDFRLSTNHPAASGEAARHARHTGPGPTNSLTVREGCALMRRLSDTWLRSL